MSKHDIRFRIDDDGVEVTIYTMGDDPSFRFKLDDTAAAQEWTEHVNREWLRAMKEREADLERSERFDRIRRALDDECGAEDLKE